MARIHCDRLVADSNDVAPQPGYGIVVLGKVYELPGRIVDAIWAENEGEKSSCDMIGTQVKFIPVIVWVHEMWSNITSL